MQTGRDANKAAVNIPKMENAMKEHIVQLAQTMLIDRVALRVAVAARTKMTANAMCQPIAR